MSGEDESGEVDAARRTSAAFGRAARAAGVGAALSRRSALGVIGGTTAVLVTGSTETAAAPAERRARFGALTRGELLGRNQALGAQLQQAAAVAGAPVRTVRLARASDQLDVLIEFFDVEFDGDSFRDLGLGGSGLVRLTFGSQHTAETAFQSATGITPPTTIVDHTAARTSHVVAPVLGTHDLSIDGILGLVRSSLVVQETAGPVDDGATVLEIPAGLALSPTDDATVDASAEPFTVGDTTELWLANLQGGPGGLELTAVENLADGDLTNAIPTSVDRDNLVDNTAVGPAIGARQLQLSSSGAFARLEGEWPGQVLTGYRQHIVTGRDISVEIESTGYLAPFGVRAAITTTTERIFAADTSNKLTSAMRLERYLTILDATTDLGGRDHQRDGGRRNLWVSVSASTDETREIVGVPVVDDGGAIPGVEDITYLDDGSDVVIDYVAVDRNGDEVTFSLPATYITGDEAHTAGPNAPSTRLAGVFNSPARNARRDVDVDGQRVAFADPVAAGQTSKSTHEIRFELDTPDGGAPGGFFGDAEVPAFNPAMKRATVTDPVLDNTTPFAVEFHPRWLDFGLDPDNFDLGFLTLQTPKLGTIGGDLPTKSVAAIEVVGEIFNQLSGAAPDLPTVDTPWDAAEALGEGSKVLGSILLSSLLDLVPPADAIPGIDIPNTEVITDADGVTVIYSFKPTLKSNTAVGFIANPDTQCCVTITTVAPFDEPPLVTTETVVSDFSMVFPPGGVVEIVEIEFNSVTAIVTSPGNLVVDPSIKGWKLGDDLNFLQPLFDTLSSLGGINVDVGSEFLALDASVNLPSLSIGIVKIKNFHLEFGLELPLEGQPVALSAGIGSPSNQIEVVAGIFGGSFYTTLDLDFHESDVDWRVAAGISLFYEIGFDAVVVDASVRLRCALGFVFNRSENGDRVKVTGSVSLEGEVNVLGLVEVSVDVRASITYKSRPQEAVVKGTIHWAVDTFLGGVDGKVPLGKITYDLSSDDRNALARGARALADGGPVPTARAMKGALPAAASLGAGALLAQASPGADRASFGDLMSQQDWADYSNAFA